jgi:hypothetical protein
MNSRLVPKRMTCALEARNLGMADVSVVSIAFRLFKVTLLFVNANLDNSASLLPSVTRRQYSTPQLIV